MVKSKSCVLKIIPIYLNCSKWAEEFEEFYSHLREIYSENIVVIGDLNARTSTMQELDVDTVNGTMNLNRFRRSEDVEINQKGKRVLEACKDFSLIILNGRCEGDSEGKMTFHGGMGDSLIDYCLSDSVALKHATHFSVGPPMHWDHLPLELKFCIDSLPRTQRNTIQRVRWVPSKQNWYNNAVLNMISE